MGVDKDRGDFLVTLISRYVRPEGSILEVGCKGGKNLYPLYRAGLTELTGIEESPERVRQIESRFPEVWERVRVIQGPLEKSMSGFADGEFEMVFSVGCFEEERDYGPVFDEMARVADRFLIVIEDERKKPGDGPGRNFRELFEKRGLGQVEELDVAAQPGLDSVFFCRVFEKK